jgi:hypothetical protein
LVASDFPFKEMLRAQVPCRDGVEMAVGSKSGSGLSVRAANVLYNLGINDADGYVACAVALVELATSHNRTPECHLMYQKHAGPVTRREILGWCQLLVEPALHVCTCRTCGRTFGKCTGDSGIFPA